MLETYLVKSLIIIIIGPCLICFVFSLSLQILTALDRDGYCRKHKLRHKLEQAINLMSGSSWEERMDWRTDGRIGGWGRRMEEGEVKTFCFSELSKQSAELLSVGPNWQPQLRPLSNQSISNLFLDWLIDLKTDYLDGWDPNYLRLVGFGVEKSVSKPIWIHLQRDFNMEWSHFGSKMMQDASVGLDFRFKFTAGCKQGSKQKGPGCGKTWKLS